MPPSMAQQGLTGEVVAKEVLDKVAQFDASTQSSRSSSSYDKIWGDDLKIDIPQTGATADQIWKLLREWLGKERAFRRGHPDQGRTRVDHPRGQRAGAAVVSKTNDLDSLVSQGGLAIYQTTQPYRSAIYLLRNEREAEGRAILQSLSSNPNPRERKWAFVGLAWDARNGGRMREASQLYRRALAIDPKMLNALAGLAITEEALGHDQLSAHSNAQYLKTAISREYDAKVAGAGQCGSKLDLGWLTRDLVLINAAGDCLETAPDGGSAPLARAAAQLLRHDWQPASVYLQPANPSYPELNRAENEAAIHLFAQLDAGRSAALAQNSRRLSCGCRGGKCRPQAGPGLSCRRTDRPPAVPGASAGGARPHQEASVLSR